MCVDEKGVLKNPQENTCAELFFSCKPLASNFVKKRVKRKCFPVFPWKKKIKTVFTDALGTRLRIYSTPPDDCF